MYAFFFWHPQYFFLCQRSLSIERHERLASNKKFLHDTVRIERFLERAKELVYFKPQINHVWISWFLNYFLLLEYYRIFILNSRLLAPFFQNSELNLSGKYMLITYKLVNACLIPSLIISLSMSSIKILNEWVSEKISRMPNTSISCLCLFL